jgi:glycosyltransferase involved in cell wall biosynthesis
MKTAVSPLTISLILPVLNHEPRLEQVLRDIQTVFSDRQQPEVLVVYDVTKPGILDAVRAEQHDLEERYGIRSVTRINERGFGGALRAGFEASTGDVIVPVMGDCSDDISSIPRMVEKIVEGTADVVSGSRYAQGGGIVGDTPKQRLSRLFSIIMGTVSTISTQDVSNGFKAYRREVWENIKNDSVWFDMSVEMTVKAAAHGYRITQVPTVWTNRNAGKSAFSMMGEFPRYSRWIFYAARHSPSRPFFFGVTVGAGTALLLSRTLSSRSGDRSSHSNSRGPNSGERKAG